MVDGVSFVSGITQVPATLASITGTLGTSQGGTGQDLSGSTGWLLVTAGTVSAEATINASTLTGTVTRSVSTATITATNIGVTTVVGTTVSATTLSGTNITASGTVFTTVSGSNYFASGSAGTTSSITLLSVTGLVFKNGLLVGTTA